MKTRLRHYLWFIVTCMMLYVDDAAGTTPDTALSKNPFRHPPTLLERGNQPVNGSTDGDDRPFELRATLVSTSATRVDLADVGGKILTEGDTHQGYRLILIQEGKATFRKNDRDVVLTVRAEDHKTDEQ